MNDQYEYVAQTLMHIIKKHLLDVNFENIGNKITQGKLLGTEIGLRPRHLVYILNDIEKEFDITIPEEEIVYGRFDTFDNISSLIIKQLKVKVMDDISVDKAVKAGLV
jgi:peptide maturation system acyl carrier-related protein